MEDKYVAIYIDLENVGNIDINTLIELIPLKAESEADITISIKRSYGSSDGMPKKVRPQLRDNNFEILDTPHFKTLKRDGSEATKDDPSSKNRADLILSLDAFETLLNERPKIDLYVFVASDRDYSVVTERFRKYGKEVWIISANTKRILANACDKLLSLDELRMPSTKNKAEHESSSTVVKGQLKPSKKSSTTVPPNQDFLVADGRAMVSFAKVIAEIASDKLPIPLAAIGNKMVQLDKSYDASRTSFKKLDVLAKEFEKAGAVKMSKIKGHPYISEVYTDKLDKFLAGCGNSS